MPQRLDAGVAGGSARTIADRQQAKRDRQKQLHDAATRQAHPRLGKVVIKARDLLAEPDTPTSWQKGAAGEETVGRRLDRLREEGYVVLHDRRKPGTKWNIDHIVVGPAGVYVIDAKHYSGPLKVRPTGTMFRPGPNRVFVKGRHHDKRVAAMDWQVECVTAAAGELVVGYGGVIKPVLCFVGVEVSLMQRAAVVGRNNVVVTWPRRFVKDIRRQGSLTAEQMTEVGQRIADALPAATARRPGS